MKSYSDLPRTPPPLPYSAIFLRYYLYPTLRAARRNLRLAHVLGSTPFLLILLLFYATYCSIVYRGVLPISATELKLTLLPYVSAAFFVRRRQIRSTTLFHCSTPSTPATIFRLQALSNLPSFLPPTVLYVLIIAPLSAATSPGSFLAVAAIASDVSLLSIATLALAISPIVARLDTLSVRIWITGAIAALFAVQVIIRDLWPPASLLFILANVGLLAAFWMTRLEAKNTDGPDRIYHALVRDFSTSARARLISSITQFVPISTSVYLRLFSFTPFGLGTIISSYGLAVFLFLELQSGASMFGLSDDVALMRDRIVLVVTYAATMLASLVYLEGLASLPFTFHKTTPVSFARLSRYLLTPHLILFSPVALAGAYLGVAAGNSVATAAMIVAIAVLLPTFAWFIGVRYSGRRLFPAMLYISMGICGMVAVAIKPLAFVGCCVALLLILFRGASRVYAEAAAEQSLGRPYGTV